jgi:sodium pump decarboxylase gamma subunit
MELLVQATTVMVLGMTVTFAFLGVVIAGVNLSALVIHRIEGAPKEEGDETGPLPGAQDRRKIVAAIAAALTHKPPEKP